LCSLWRAGLIVVYCFFKVYIAYRNIPLWHNDIFHHLGRFRESCRDALRKWSYEGIADCRAWTVYEKCRLHMIADALNDVDVDVERVYRAFSLPGQFAPWPFRPPAFSLTGTKVLWNFRSVELSFPGTFVPWNFRSLNVSIAVYFRCLTLAFTPITQCEDHNNKIEKVQRNGRECINKIPNYEQNSMQCLSVPQKIGLRDFRLNAFK